MKSLIFYGMFRSRVGKIELSDITSESFTIIDGKESVGFLVAVKEALENPVEILLGGEENVKENLDL